MKKLKKKDAESMSPDEMKAKIKEFRTEMVKQNAQVATGTVQKNPMAVRNLKKNIARMLTRLNSKRTEAKPLETAKK